MQRLIEQPVDEGDVFEGQTRLGRVQYHLSVYQHFSESDDAALPAHLGAEGRLIAIEHVDFGDLHKRRAELRLKLADGRMLDFLMADATGTIRSTGRGLQ